RPHGEFRGRRGHPRRVGVPRSGARRCGTLPGQVTGPRSGRGRRIRDLAGPPAITRGLWVCLGPDQGSKVNTSGKASAAGLSGALSTARAALERVLLDLRAGVEACPRPRSAFARDAVAPGPARPSWGSDRAVAGSDPRDGASAARAKGSPAIGPKPPGGSI